MARYGGEDEWMGRGWGIVFWGMQSCGDDGEVLEWWVWEMCDGIGEMGK